MVIQSRNLPGEKQVGQHYTSGVKAATELSPYANGSQTTDSYRTINGVVVGEPRYEDMTGVELRKRVNYEGTMLYDNGHNFKTEKQWVTPPTGGNYFSVPVSPTARNVYVGQVAVTETSFANLYPNLTAPSEATRKSDGRRGIAGTLPTAPEAGLAAILGELRQRLPTLIGWETFVKSDPRLRNIGDEFLNVQFGILPTKADIQEVAVALSNFHKETRQLRNRANINVRRRVTISEGRTLTDVSFSNSQVNLPRRNLTNVNSQFFSGGVSKCQDLVEHKTWFAGAYTYYLDLGQNFLAKLDRYEQQLNHLLGLEITPEVIWQLTPWSWIIDWFSDAGVFFRNISHLSADNSVLRYGYVMHQINATRIRTVSNLTPVNLGHGNSTIPSTFTYMTHKSLKQRTKSTPYGFDTDLNTMSAKRWSILGALGMTRSPRSLM